MSIALWSLVVVSILLKFYFIVEPILARPRAHTFNRHVRGVTFTIGQKFDERYFVVFDPHNLAAIAKLQQTANKISSQIVYSNDETDSLIEWIGLGEDSTPIEVPAALSAGENLRIARVDLIQSHKHPNWDSERAVVLGQERSGRLIHITWNSKEAQLLYQGDRPQVV